MATGPTVFIKANDFCVCVLKAQKPPQKPSPASASSVPVVKDTLVKKTEGKLKIDTANTFQAFKRTEVKVRGDFCRLDLWTPTPRAADRKKNVYTNFDHFCFVYHDVLLSLCSAQ